MKQLFYSSIVIIFCFTILTGCGEQKKETFNSQNETVKIVMPKALTAAPIMKIKDGKKLGKKYNVKLIFYSSMDEMMAIAAKKDFDFMCLPANTAAVLYNKGIPLKFTNIGVWGGIYLSSTEKKITNFTDLKGEKLYIPNRGSVPDFITQYFLTQSGLQPGKDVELVYSTHPEISQLLANGNIKNAIDVEPFATSNKNKINGYQIIADYNEQWKKENKEYDMLPNQCICVNNNVVQNNNTLVNSFNEKYKEALQWTADNPKEAAKLVHDNINIDEKLTENAIPNLQFHYKNSVNAKRDFENYFYILNKLKPESIGGKIPDKGFYYEYEK